MFTVQNQLFLETNWDNSLEFRKMFLLIHQIGNIQCVNKFSELFLNKEYDIKEQEGLYGLNMFVNNCRFFSQSHCPNSSI